jgi:hypothetical protein
MKDPERFSDRHSSAFARSLLAGASDEEPPPGLLGRTLGSIGAAGVMSLTAEAHATATTSGAAVAGSGAPGMAATGAVAAKGMLVTFVKGVGIGGTVAALATGAAFELQQGTSHSPSTAPVVGASETRRPKQAPKAAVKERTPEAERTISPDELPVVETPEPAPMRDPRGAATERGGDSHTALRDEALLIDRAREAVASGDGGAALRALEDHRTKFKSPVFQPEALYLRLQALRLLGNDAAARLVAKRLLAAYPNGAQAASARAFLKTPEP